MIQQTEPSGSEAGESRVKSYKVILTEKAL
jgi:hypothetical protein